MNMKNNTSRIHFTLLGCILTVFLLVVPALKTEAAVYGSAARPTTITSKSYSSLATNLRTGMINRDSSVQIYVRYNANESINHLGIMQDVIDKAMAENYAGNAGDYLNYTLSGIKYRYGAPVDYQFIGNDLYFVLLYEFMPSFRDDASKENSLKNSIKNELSGMGLSGKSDYDKVTAIYNFICNRVKYDNAAARSDDSGSYRLSWTAYGAYTNRQAVCQGYALLFYRMCNQAGIRARIVDGAASGSNGREDHAWNIVRVGGQWYNVDVTWDAAYKQSNLPYEYFLKNTADFKNHWVDTSSTASGNGDRNRQILKQCPIASKSYGAKKKYTVTITGGTVAGKGSSGTFDAGTVVQVTANAAPLAGQTFSRWTGTATYTSGNSSKSTISIKVSKNTTLKATYAYTDANVTASAYKVTSVSASKSKNALNSQKNSKKANAPIVLAASKSSPQFKVAKAGSGFYYLMNAKSKKYLSLKGTKAVQGTKGAATSKWRIVKSTGSSYRLINKNGKALTVSGSNLGTASDSNKKTQQFKLPKK